MFGIASGASVVWTVRLFHEFKVAFLHPNTAIGAFAELNPIHRLSIRIQANQVFLRLMDLLDGANFVLADSSNTILRFELHAHLQIKDAATVRLSRQKLQPDGKRSFTNWLAINNSRPGPQVAVQ